MTYSILYILSMLAMACFGVFVGMVLKGFEMKNHYRIPLIFHFVVILILVLMSAGLLFFVRLGGAAWIK